MKIKGFLLWLSAILITLSAAYYQRKTGPTHPEYFNVTLNNKTYEIKLKRAHITDKDTKVELPVYDTTIKASLYYKTYQSNEGLIKVDFFDSENGKTAYLKNMPAAGKIEYFIEFNIDDEYTYIAENNPVITRFRNDVPSWALIPHIIFIFFAMLFSTVTGLFVIPKSDKYKFYMKTTIILLILGGFIFGPIVQKFAFGEFWTGFPFGYDLTDNKTLIAFIFWITAFILNIRVKRPAWVVTASLIMILIFSIPHSMWGSKLDNETGKVVTGRG